MPIISVRRAEKSDASSIAAIYSESIAARDSTMDLDPFTHDDALNLLCDLGQREAIFVAETDHQVLGWGNVKTYSTRPGYRVACETSVYVFRSHTGQGIGSSIQTSLIEHAKSQGFRHIVTKIWAENELSIAFHRQFGFSLVGIQNEIGEVDGKKKDIAIMQCL
ncbi:MAG: N-acetyltransferase family protein [Bacteroidetes bacterium]|nr:MAG: N-acetyltransferase family protein [Bacteroidota bacterium]